MKSPLLPRENFSNLSINTIDIFRNQKQLALLLYGWLLILFYLMISLGVGDSHFLNFGPSEYAFFLSIPIDTWYKWSILSIFMFCNTLVNVFTNESMYPWIQNTIQDHKNRYIPYPKAVCVWICQTYYFYVNVINIFSLFGVFVQIDFLLIRVFADLIVSYYTTTQFIRSKIYDEEAYIRELHYPEAV